MNDPNPQLDLAAIENFIGYGAIDAPVVFIGIEEAIARADQCVAGLLVRSGFQQVMDVQHAHAAGLPHDIRLFNEANALSQPTWRPMCELLLRREPGALLSSPHERRRALKQYQSTLLGRNVGISLLAELLPLPHASTGDWWYNNFYREIHTRSQYEEFMLPQRTTLLAQQLALHPRQLVMCYGQSHFAAFRVLIEQFAARLGHRALSPSDWQGIRLVNPTTGREWNVRRTIVGETNIVLANHLTRMPLCASWALEALAQALW